MGCIDSAESSLQTRVLFDENHSSWNQRNSIQPAGLWLLAYLGAHGIWHAVTRESEAKGRAAVLAAYEAGYTLFDHADIYCDGVAESIFGKFLKETPAMRERIVIARNAESAKSGEPDAKAPFRYDFSAEHIIRSCEAVSPAAGGEHHRYLSIAPAGFPDATRGSGGSLYKIEKCGEGAGVWGEQFLGRRK